MTYRTVRYYQKRPHMSREVLTEGLTLEQAQAHCSNPETSSTTCKQENATCRTMLHGPWFDGYEKEQ